MSTGLVVLMGDTMIHWSQIEVFIRSWSYGKNCVCELISDTSSFLSHTCNSFVELTKYLLAAGNDYVIFGWFTTDFLEKYFWEVVSRFWWNIFHNSSIHYWTKWRFAISNYLFNWIFNLRLILGITVTYVNVIWKKENEKSYI